MSNHPEDCQYKQCPWDEPEQIEDNLVDKLEALEAELEEAELERQLDALDYEY